MCNNGTLDYYSVKKVEPVSGLTKIPLFVGRLIATRGGTLSGVE